MGRVRRLAVLPAVLCTLSPLATLAALLSDAYADLSWSTAGWALAGLVIILPMEVVLVVQASRGQGRSARDVALLLAIAAVTVGLTPLVGGSWPPVYQSVGLAVLIVLPWRASVPLFVLLVGVQFPLAEHFAPDGGGLGGGLLQAVFVLRALAILAVILLVVRLRQVAVAREELRSRAVARERERLAEDLHRTVGVELEAVSRRSARLVDLPPDELEPELRAVVAEARAVLSRTRRVTRSYRRPSIHGELHAAAALLKAAGVPVEIVAPRDVSDTPHRRAELRAHVSRLLAQPPPDPTRLVIFGADGPR